MCTKYKYNDISVNLSLITNFRAAQCASYNTQVYMYWCILYITPTGTQYMYVTLQPINIYIDQHHSKYRDVWKLFIISIRCTGIRRVWFARLRCSSISEVSSETQLILHPPVFWTVREVLLYACLHWLLAVSWLPPAIAKIMFASRFVLFLINK